MTTAETSNQAVPETAPQVEETLPVAEPSTAAAAEKTDEPVAEPAADAQEEAKPLEPISAGYLSKRGPRPLRLWKARYFTLREEPVETSQLRLMFKKNEKKVKATVPPKPAAAPAAPAPAEPEKAEETAEKPAEETAAPAAEAPAIVVHDDATAAGALPVPEATAPPAKTPTTPGVIGISDDKEPDEYEQANSVLFRNLAHATATGKGLLFYFISEKDQVPHGIINLAHVTDVAEGEKTGRAHSFIVKTEYREWTLAASNDTDRNRWIKTLKEEVEKAKAAPDVHEQEPYKECYSKLVNKQAFSAPARTLAAPHVDEAAHSASETEAEGEKRLDVAQPSDAPEKRKSYFGVIGEFLTRSHKETGAAVAAVGAAAAGTAAVVAAASGAADKKEEAIAEEEVKVEAAETGETAPAVEEGAEKAAEAAVDEAGKEAAEGTEEAKAAKSGGGGGLVRGLTSIFKREKKKAAEGGEATVEEAAEKAEAAAEQATEEAAKAEEHAEAATEAADKAAEEAAKETAEGTEEAKAAKAAGGGLVRGLTNMFKRDKKTVEGVEATAEEAVEKAEAATEHAEAAQDAAQEATEAVAETAEKAAEEVGKVDAQVETSAGKAAGGGLVRGLTSMFKRDKKPVEGAEAAVAAVAAATAAEETAEKAEAVAEQAAEEAAKAEDTAEAAVETAQATAEEAVDTPKSSAGKAAGGGLVRGLTSMFKRDKKAADATETAAAAATVDEATETAAPEQAVDAAQEPAPAAAEPVATEPVEVPAETPSPPDSQSKRKSFLATLLGKKDKVEEAAAVEAIVEGAAPAQETAAEGERAVEQATETAEATAAAAAETTEITEAVEATEATETKKSGGIARGLSNILKFGGKKQEVKKEEVVEAEAAPVAETAAAAEPKQEEAPQEPSEDVIRTGQLEKQSALLKSYEKRAFTLTKDGLKYCHPGASEHKAIQITRSTEVHKVDGIKKAHAFDVKVAARTYRLVAESEEDRDAWIEALTAYRESLPEEAKPEPAVEEAKEETQPVVEQVKEETAAAAETAEAKQE